MLTVNFWESNVWGFLLLIFIVLASLLFGNYLRRTIKAIRKSLIPASVIGGIVLLIISTITKLVSGNSFFDSFAFNNRGLEVLEIMTYHFLGIGFVAMALKTNDKKFTKEKNVKIFNSGIVTVSTYLLQAFVGMIITIIFALCGSKLTFKAAGVLLAFGFGQGTGQAYNYGSMFENDFSFSGGSDFGLTIAALGFLSAAIGGVIYLNILKMKNKIYVNDNEVEEEVKLEDFHSKNEIPQSESIDKLTVQIGLIIGSYLLAYFVMLGIGELIPGLKSLIFGFNFLIGTIMAICVKSVMKFFQKKKIMKKQYISNYFMDRIGGFAFDMMIVSGIAAIKIDLIAKYWIVLLVMGIIGAFVTFFYVLFTSKALFKDYQYEQFFAMYGMLTGTASTGIILLREIDPKFESDASSNLVYQTLPAIVFGFPMMFLPKFAGASDFNTYLTLGILLILFIVMNVILFRKSIFKKKVKVNG